MSIPLDSPFYVELNGKKYEILCLTEQAGPTIRNGYISLKSCVANFLYKGKWYKVKNYAILAELRIMYDEKAKVT